MIQNIALVFICVWGLLMLWGLGLTITLYEPWPLSAIVDPLIIAVTVGFIASEFEK
jgi:hypothetical protein